MGLFMPSPTHAEQMVTAIQAKLLKAIGIGSASVGGNQVTYRNGLEKELRHWQRIVAIEQGTFKRAKTINLAGAG
jgi:hypothetical protein